MRSGSRRLWRNKPRRVGSYRARKGHGAALDNIYQHRMATKIPGLHTVLRFIDAGASPSEVFLGRR